MPSATPSNQQPQQGHTATKTPYSEMLDGKVYVRAVSGHYQRLKIGIASVLLGAFFLVPWLQLGQYPLLRMDLAHARFYFFGSVFWPQDFYIIAALFILAAFALFAVTTLRGRVWCGFSCPQTVWTSIFLGIERFVEGSRQQQIQLDKRPWDGQKMSRRLSKHLLWALFALWTGATIVGYFLPLEHFLSAPTAHFWPLFWVAFFALCTYLNAGLLREKFCLHACPYARFQSVMVNDQTQVVTYDFQRGEPRRTKLASLNQTPTGDCVDCGLCVRVCPTGVDIRNGLQLGCINCGLCIDACDNVMKKVSKPLGLIKITAQSTLNEVENSSAKNTRFAAYLITVGLATIALFWSIAGRPLLELDVVRERNRLYQTHSDGTTSNTYVVRVLNKTPAAQKIHLTITGLTNPDIKGPVEFFVPAGESLEQDIRVHVRDAKLNNTSMPILFHARAEQNHNLVANEKSQFFSAVKTTATF